MMAFKSYNFSQGFLSLISLLIVLIVIIILLVGIYFGFNKISLSNSNQPGQKEQFSPQEAIQEAEKIKDLLEAQEKYLE